MSTREDSDLPGLLLSLEQQLMDPVFRKDRKKVSALLAAEFREFGSSGGVWSRDAILDMLEKETQFTTPHVEDFAIQKLAPDVALATYRTVGSKTQLETLRSSLWVCRNGAWKILFHQGTKIADT